jgi:hypothetical protein
VRVVRKVREPQISVDVDRTEVERMMDHITVSLISLDPIGDDNKLNPF